MKDYHKGKKINAYVPEELSELLNQYSELYGVTKTHIIVDALYSFIGPAARDSIHRAYKEKFGDNA